MSQQKSAIVVVIDRLGAGFLGPYGNTWLETPNFNRLAAESVLFESAIVDSPDLRQCYRAYLQGRHAASPDLDQAGSTLLARLAAKQIACTLVTDERSIVDLQVMDCFSEVVVVPKSDHKSTSTIEQTQLARTFAESIDRLHSSRSGFLFWLHASGMQGPWDAPFELRRQFADEEDPDTPDFVEPPSLRLEADADPDEILGITHCFAGQVVVSDICLGALLDAVENSPWAKDVLIVFTSPRGYPLGEHKLVGTRDEALYGELLHVPCLVRIPDRGASAGRNHTLVQPPDLFATLCEWFELPSGVDPLMSASLLSIAGDSSPLRRDRLCSTVGDQQAIRTPAWFMRRDANSSELFVKPDDRWEFNEVSDRCPDVVEELTGKLDEFIQAAQNNDLSSLSPLSDVLLHGPD